MTDIYQQFNSAFRNISAYAVLREGKPVAHICFKYGTAVTAYVHWYGLEMQRGQARGGGYDRASAACAAAVSKTRTAWQHPVNDGDWSKFCQALYDGDNGPGWERCLRDAGFEIVNVIC